MRWSIDPASSPSGQLSRRGRTLCAPTKQGDERLRRGAYHAPTVRERLRRLSTLQVPFRGRTLCAPTKQGDERLRRGAYHAPTVRERLRWLSTLQVPFRGRTLCAPTENVPGAAGLLQWTGSGPRWVPLIRMYGCFSGSSHIRVRSSSGAARPTQPSVGPFAQCRKMAQPRSGIGSGGRL